MESEKQNFRHILLFYYRKGKNAASSKKKIIGCVWRRCIDRTPVPKLVCKFRSGNFDVEGAPRSGKPVEADEDTIKALIDANRRITTREIAERLNLSNSTVHE